MRTGRSSPYREGGLPDRDTPLDKETTPVTENPPLIQRPVLEGTWDQAQRPPRRNMGPGSQTGSDIIHRPSPVNRMTDRQV